MAGACEESEEVTVTERSYTLLLQRQKYRCRCNGAVVTAPGPLRLIPGGRYSTDFAVHVAVGKYGDHLPLERQVAIMERHGLAVASQALRDQLEAAAAALTPSYEALGRWLDVCSRSRCCTRMRPAGRCMRRATAWVRLASSKSEAMGRKVLAGYRGTVVADGYRVYKNLAQSNRDGPGYRLAHCWARVLRRFRAAAENERCSLWALEQIGTLYEVERESLLEARGEAARHLALRQECAGPLLAQLRRWSWPREDFAAAPTCSRTGQA